MKIPLSWIKDFVDIDMNIEELAHLMTMIGLEVEEIILAGLPMPPGEKHEFKISGISWDADKIVVGRVDEVLPHPNADRLSLLRLNDGQSENIVLCGAPELLPLRDTGALDEPILVAWAKEGATIYDGHQPGFKLTTLKKMKIRGVESSSMACSEKELGISDEHGGVIHLDEDAPLGAPLVDYMGDAVFDIAILPNNARNTSVYGVAREIAAATGKTLRALELTAPADGPSVQGQVSIEITDPELNPRFVFGLVKGVKAQPSPYRVQRRLRLAGMRPINSVVDATNYVMLEIGEPLHAFDYDILVERAGGKAPKIITRSAKPGERLTTLDDVDRPLDDFTIMVTDTAGSLALAGVMGGLESEVTEKTVNVLLEGASWNLINTRRTVMSQRLSSEAAYRFARGVHPELAPLGVQHGLERMAQWSGGQIAADLVDAYPEPLQDTINQLTPERVSRQLGIELPAQEIKALLERLEFECSVEGETITVKTPSHRLDIGAGVIGQADLIEEVARMYGYENIPSTRLADALPPQRGNPLYEGVSQLKDKLVSLGLQEIITYLLTSPEVEAKTRRDAKQAPDYVRLQNPITTERVVMRRALLPGVLENLERNIRLSERLAFFEIGPIFVPRPGSGLPLVSIRLAIAMTGRRRRMHWSAASQDDGMDFYDLKGIIESLVENDLESVVFELTEHPSFHPGKCARLSVDGLDVGVFGELHPLVKEHYDFGPAPVLAADLDARVLLDLLGKKNEIEAVPAFPPVLEDIAVIVDETVAVGQLEDVIRKAGGKLLADVKLFDVYRSEQIGAGKKSLAFSLTYMAPDRTLTDKEAAKVRNKIVRRLEEEVGAQLRG